MLIRHDAMLSCFCYEIVAIGCKTTPSGVRYQEIASQVFGDKALCCAGDAVHRDERQKTQAWRQVQVVFRDWTYVYLQDGLQNMQGR